MANYTTYPLNREEDYDAEDAQVYTCTRESGVYANDHFTATVSGTNRDINIGVGLAWQKLADFKGTAFASEEPVKLTLEISDPVLPRYDVIAINFNTSINEGQGEIIYITGTPASTPQIPTISRSESLFQHFLYAIYRPAGSSVIRQQDLQDLRLNNTYCGIMRDGVTGIDTSVINNQITDFLEEMKDLLNENTAVYLQNQIDDYKNILPLNANKNGLRVGDSGEIPTDERVIFEIPAEFKNNTTLPLDVNVGTISNNVPIAEKIEDANGFCVRFYDGTQICYGQDIPIRQNDYYAITSRNFSRIFIKNPLVTVGLFYSDNSLEETKLMAGVGDISTSGLNLVQSHSEQGFATMAPRYMFYSAFGHWK